jgi:hypothetical protein
LAHRDNTLTSIQAALEVLLGLSVHFNFFSLDAPVDIPYMRHFETVRFVARPSHGQERETLVKEHKVGSVIGIPLSLNVDVVVEHAMISGCVGWL